MHIVIMGCGRVGSTLAQRLEGRGHSVAVIDSDPDAFRRLGPSFAGMTVTGLGFDRDIQRRAGIERADAFAAVSSGDNSNIISARVAREQFGVDTVVARIYDPGRAEVYERLGVPTVATVTWAADQVLRKLLPAGHSSVVYTDPSGKVRADQVFVPQAWVGRTVGALESATRTRVASVSRYGAAEIPDTAMVLQDGDVLHLFSRISDSETVFATLSEGPRQEES
ncbi:TrkA family potassium uptake protein [Mumia zhuanghuii]|uniref:Trk system potassium uptake protein TrkA n=2 Tax=Mumia zhuanghuii TaxID=2585211 RepID=A0A5C4MBB3_9ACTN|nr:TrkA family potassium uptake protein [Mumia zhuanghuii]TNC29339.1 TrkA family potassium uptake protein [Mumia zhuanghuii]TNC49673.1 TrkA family potassium uptake protein [Mumia zhuanghuii]